MSLYTYRAKVVRVVDADTIDFEIDLGFHMTAHIRTRLARINAWETRGNEREKGLKAKRAVIDLLPGYESGEYVTVETHKTGKYGRWIAEVFIADPGARDINLSNWLLAEGHAKKVDW